MLPNYIYNLINALNRKGYTNEEISSLLTEVCEEIKNMEKLEVSKIMDK